MSIPASVINLDVSPLSMPKASASNTLYIASDTFSPPAKSGWKCGTAIISLPITALASFNTSGVTCDCKASLEGPASSIIPLA